jgi:putative DNA primase/helicase
MIEGCKLWQNEGLEPPECVLDQTDEYFAEEDLPGQWLDECTELGEENVMASADAYRSWQIWCSKRGEQPGARRTFARTMKPYEQKLGFRKAQIGNDRLKGWSGIRLTDDPNRIQGDLT